MVPAGCPAEKAPLLAKGARCGTGNDAQRLRSRAASMEEEDALVHKLLPERSGGRYPYLDLTRLCCVCLVAIDHGGTSFGIWNVMYVQSWVLQYLFLIAGIMWGMSSSSLSKYLLRLGTYFVVGVGCNFIAFRIKGLEWRHQVWNVVFQFWFVGGLIVFVTLLAPLKKYLAAVRDRKHWSEPPPHVDAFDEVHSHVAILQGIMALVCGIVAIKAFWCLVLIPVVQECLTYPMIALGHTGDGAVHWNLPENPADAHEFLNDMFSYFQVSAISIYIIVVLPLVSRQTSIVGWLVILNTYCHRVVCYRAQEARMINSFDITMLGMTCYFLGLKHRRTIGTYMVRYWFCTLFICSILWPPGYDGRLDEHPPKNMVLRFMYGLQEMLLVILFLTGIERMMDPEIWTVDISSSIFWVLSQWGLLLFLVHKAVHILIPSPYNWLFLASLLVPLYFMRPPEEPVEKTKTACNPSGSSSWETYGASVSGPAPKSKDVRLRSKSPEP